MHRGFKFRVDPTAEQAAILAQTVGVCRLIYNVALEQRDRYWRQFKANTGHNISYPSQCRELTQLRAEVDWVGVVQRSAQEHALLDLDEAFRRFFSGVSRYPQPRLKGVNDSFRFKGGDTRIVKLSERWGAFFVPKIGMIRYRRTRDVPGTIRNIAISLSAGCWYVSFGCEIEHDVAASSLPSVGIDRGVANTLTLSTGEHMSVPASLSGLDRRLRRAKRALSRKVRGSARYARQRRRVGAIAARAARIRRDWQHRATTGIARRFSTVVIEDLNTAGLTASGPRKRGLNRAILNQGWQTIETMLAYKLGAAGGELVRVNPAYTSQCCSACGTIDKANRESQAVFVCKHCGHAEHADVNAATNILRLGSTQSQRAEAAHFAADETRTVNHSALAA